MTNSDVHAHTVALIAKILEIDPETVKGTDRLREDLGMDSLGSLELLSTVSQELTVDLDAEAAMDIETVDQAVAFIAKHVAIEHGAAVGA